MGQDGLRHIVQKDRVYAACGQSVAFAKWWGGDKTLSCLTCIARENGVDG
jgi:uncharacterized protein YndB with AHSA1/START domain